MTWSGEVEIAVVDGGGGIVSVPARNVQAVIGCAASGTVGTVVASRSKGTLKSTFMAGPLLEQAGQVVDAEGTVLAVRATTATPGAIRSTGATGGGVSAAVSGTGSTVKLTTTNPHGLISGAVVTVAAVGGTTEANGTWIARVVDTTHIELLGTTFANAYTSGGTVTKVGAVMTSNSASTGAAYLTGTPNDDYYVQAQFLSDFTAGTAGGLVALSLDAGRTYGPAIPLGTALTLALADSGTGAYDTGLTLHVVTGKTYKSGDIMRASSTAPQPDATGVAAAITALRNYLLIGGGGGYPIAKICGDVDSTFAAAVQADLTTDAAAYFFERAIVDARDASPPTAWGGTGEDDTTWAAALLSDFGSANAPRVSVAAGWYNIPSSFPTLFASVPVYRRPLGYAYAARQVAIPSQRHAGKVGGNDGGPLAIVQVNAARDAADGFFYHDSGSSPALDYFLPGGSGRFATGRRRARKVGLFLCNPLTLAQAGSNFAMLPQGLVMDVACSIAHDVLEDYVNADLLTNANGTLADTEAATIRGAVEDAIDDNMTNVAMISGRVVVVDTSQIITTTKKLVVTITIQGRAYVLEVDVTLGFANALAASAA